MNKQQRLLEIKWKIYEGKNVDLYSMDKQELISKFVDDAVFKAYNEGWKDAKKKLKREKK